MPFTCISNWGIKVKNFFSEKWKDGWEPIFYIFSWTLFIASIDKYRTKEKSRIIKRLNWDYFLITLIAAFILMYFTRNINNTKIVTELRADNLFVSCITVLGVYAFSRINEIFIAFVRDAQSQLSPMSSGSGLKYYERIMLAMRS